MLSHRLGRAEARVVGDLVHGEVGGLQEVTGTFDALPGEPLAGADAGLLAEAAGEGAHRHGLLLGHVAELDRFVQAAQRPGARGGGGRCLRLGKGTLDVLGLAPVTVRRYDRAPGHVVGDRRAVVAPYEMQAQVDPGRHAGGGQDVPVVDEEDVRVDLDLGEEALEVLGVVPVRGRRAAVQIAGGGQEVAAGADGDEAGAGADVGEGGGQFRGEDPLLVHGSQLVRGRDDDRVGGGEGLRAVRDEDREVGVRLHRARRPDRAGDDVVQRLSPRVPGLAEDALRDAQLEGEQAVEGEDDDAVAGGGGGLPGRGIRGQGPILAKAVFSATRASVVMA
ncbi:hypothetical protein SGFS_054480 [Streptomyces graminofaciens]|uniref:Uncharacterized protein n=1 Tax=Streptomyces graminofaciens TaxID=68212 RepID=A0ABN5VLG1_9ACTN|nr:hypothetical protein SGFS_054480 [Streptomyces graminofaciens]